MKGYIHSVETFGAVDGPGLRYVVFMQGCPLRCLYCHNPDSWKLKEGKKTSVKELVADIKKYKNYINGVTLSGGEPLMQPKFALSLIKAIKKLGLNVAIDTAGSFPLSFSKCVIDACDLVILDIKSIDNALCKELTGMENKNNISTLEYCESINKDVWIRQVVVPGYTLDENYLTKLAKFLSKFSCVKTVDLLPFHKFGEFKWQTLEYEYKLKSTKEPTKEEMEKAKQIFKEFGIELLK